MQKVRIIAFRSESKIIIFMIRIRRIFLEISMRKICELFSEILNQMILKIDHNRDQISRRILKVLQELDRYKLN